MPAEPTLTRGPHSPPLLYTLLDHHHHSPDLSATHGHEHLKSGGNACQRVRCSHNHVIAVSRPRSVGSVPVNPKSFKNLPNPTTHHHVNPGVFQPTSQPPFPIRSVATTPLVWRPCEFKNPFKEAGGKRTVRHRWPGWPRRPGICCAAQASQHARGVGACRSEEATRRRTATPRGE